MKKINNNALIIAAAAVGVSLAFGVQVMALSATNDQAKITAIKTAGDKEITRRLNTLNKLSTRIDSNTKLSASDKTSLQNEVTTEISGLTTLKTTLDSATTLDAAKADAKSIFSDYRVYALIVPKVWLIKTADDQQVVEAKLSALATKLQTRINNAQGQGKDVSALKTTLDDLNSQLANAQAISVSVETKVLALQPSDYNSDHTVLSGYKTQLQTAHADNQKAYSDAKTIVNGLKNL